LFRHPPIGREGIDKMEQRVNKDRRQKPTNPLHKSSLFGSRKEHRRQEDANIQIYVDRYGFSSFLAFVSGLILSLADGFFTLKILDLGGVELNPVMARLIEGGPVAFIAGKYSLTAICLLWLLLHENYYFFGKRILVKKLLFAVPVLYGALICYEIRLLHLSGHLLCAAK
jgi:hypothetical protein